MAYMLGAKEIMPMLVASFVGSGVVFHAIRNMKVLGGDVPTTLTEEWADQTIALTASKPREGSSKPAQMDPLTNGYPMNFSVTDDGDWTLKKIPKRSKSMSYLHGYGTPVKSPDIFESNK